LAESVIWKKVGGKDPEMPPPDEPQPTAEERDLIKKWIETGATPFPEDEGPARPFKTELDILTAIRDYMQGLDRADRRFQRFFTFTHLHNNKSIRTYELRLARAALSKVVNSLTWAPDIVMPRAIDKEETIFAIDLRKLDWDKRNLWREILKYYPYGLKHDSDRSPVLANMARDLYEITGTDIPYLRADWFIVTAAQPPLYHTLVYDEALPSLVKRRPDYRDLKNPKKMTDYDLERDLNVNVGKNFLRDELARAGFAKSGVSRQNRLVERHRAAYGAYWKSYDFKANAPDSNLFQYPLGPGFKENPYPKLAFRQAGGEIIFTLPNGMQGYLLVDEKGNRIDEGPTEVVIDSKETAGKANVVNAISCMHCHQNGMIRFSDTVRGARGV